MDEQIKKDAAVLQQLIDQVAIPHTQYLVLLGALNRLVQKAETACAGTDEQKG